MTRSASILGGLVVGLSIALAPPGAVAQSAMPDAQRKAVEEVVRDYILNNPEIVMEAIQRLRDKKAMAEAEADRQAVAEHAKEIFNDPTSPVGGNADGDVTLVEFFDYRCGVCKGVHPIVKELIKSDPKIRKVYKEWPILGPDSVRAARAALASRHQGKYLAFHTALMEARGNLDEGALFTVARAVGLDVGQLKTDMTRPEVEEVLHRNFALAEKLRLNGTPSFLIGNQIIRGGRDLQSLREIVAEARSAKE